MASSSSLIFTPLSNGGRFAFSGNPIRRSLNYASRSTKIPSMSVRAQTMDFSGSFFEGGLEGDNDPPMSPGSGLTAVEEKEEPQCPPGLRKYETMAVLRPGMSEDERLTLTHKYEEECRINELKVYNQMNLVQFLEQSINSFKSCSSILQDEKNLYLPALNGLNKPSLDQMKFMMLCAFFALQGAEQAGAASDIASQLQSSSFLGDPGDISTGFASAFLLIFFSELGDKTFFIAALLAARNSAGVVFLGTFGALGAMTIISVIIGRTFHYVDDILPFRFGNADLPVDDIAAACLLIYFGVSTLIDASSSDGGKADEEQKEAELAVSDFSGNGAGILAIASTAVSTFLLVFVAEWGDKSFFSTIALAAASSPLGVVGGALAGHGAATLLAVLGGSLLGSFLSEKVVAYIGGILFLVFAAVTLIEIVS